MAAKLKKRALAEYHSQVETVDEKKEQKSQKKLKLLLPRSSRTLSSSSSTTPPTRRGSSSCEDSYSNRGGTGRDASTLIVGVTPTILNRDMDAGEVSELAKRLCDVLANQSRLDQDGDVRAQLYLCLATIAAKYCHKEEEVIPPDQCDEWLHQLKNEQSGKAKAAIMALFAEWLQAGHRMHTTTQSALLQAVKDHLKEQNHLVKMNCLRVLGSGTHVLAASDRSLAREILSLAGRHTKSQDPRVRKSAFEALLDIHKHGHKLDSGTYSDICSVALDDDYEGVRLAGLKLVQVMAVSYPEETVLVSDGSTVRLVDDAFGKICNAVQDLCVQVRELSVHLIGQMEGVSQMYLEQTLDKKLMSNMRSKKSAHQRQAQMVASGEWSSGKKWADDAPREEVDANEVNLMAFGACGAFIHGLEDEFLAVRTQAINSLTKLSIGNSKLASLALDFLVDMFNDEIEQVRVKAIESLTLIADHITLQSHQLETILWALDDCAIVVREKLHLMLQSSTIATKDGLQNVVGKLLENLKRYPQDKRSILMTCKKLGATHAELTLPLVTQLLEIHPFFDTAEPDIEEPSYLCILVLVFNAAHLSPSLGPLLDQHTKRHYHYIVDTYPHLLPQDQIQIQGQNNLEKNTKTFVKQVMESACRQHTGHLKMEARLTILQQCGRDLKRLSDIEPDMSDAATFAHTYIQCQCLLLRCLSSRFWTNGPQVMQTQQGEIVSSSIQELFKLSLQLESLYKGLSPSHRRQISLLKLQIRALHLVFLVRASNKSALNSTECFLKEIEAVKKSLQEGEVEEAPFLKELLKKLDEEKERKPGAIVRIVQPLLLAYPLEPLSFDNSVKMSYAVIYEPQGNNETPLKYTAGMVLAVPVDCELFNVEDTRMVRIAIRTPDQKVVLFTPKSNEFFQKDGNCKRLLTNALMSHQVWSEALHVEISIVLDLASKRDFGLKPTSGRGSYENLVHLCEPVKVYVLPKAVKRGI